MSNFDATHIMHLQMMATFKEYKIATHEEPEPDFSWREEFLVGTLVDIMSERWSAKEMRSRAQHTLELWIEHMSPEMRLRLGLKETEASKPAP